MTAGDDLRKQARAYYEDKLRLHGPVAAGVDWNSEGSQQLRFRQFERLWHDQPDASLLDYGCGYGALAGYVRERGHRGRYLGFDVSEAMIDAAQAHAASWRDCSFTSRRAALAQLDYAVASGVLNVKQGVEQSDWEAFVRDTIDDLATLGTRGFAFNLLTMYSDPEKRRPGLYYAEPLGWFDHCQRKYSRHVALLHDYGLWEFTILVRHSV